MLGRVCLLGIVCGACLTKAANPPEWSRPYPAHKVAGNVYYVGTEDLGCFLVTGNAGHILINTGLANSTPLIREGVEKLGFQFKDIKILLTMQAHYDHVAAFAEVQNLTGAKVYATVADAAVLEDGGKSDPYLSAKEYNFAPVKVERKLKDGDTVKLGSTELKVHLAPGHTMGSVSYSTEVTENGKKQSLLFANMGSVVMPLYGNPKYPGIIRDFEKTFEAQRKMKPDIWVAGHGSQYGMAAKHKAGSFVDPQGYHDAVEKYAKLFEQQKKIQAEK